MPEGEGDSGVGLFLSGSDNFVPPCLEVQILNGHAGDLYPVGGFQADGSDGKPIVYSAERIAQPEEHKDDWNQMELKVRAGTLEVRVNGELVNRASGAPIGETRLTLLNQSSRVEFRGIVLSPTRVMLILTTGGTIDKVYFDANSEYEVGEPMVPHVFREVGAQLDYRLLPLHEEGFAGDHR